MPQTCSDCGKYPAIFRTTLNKRMRGESKHNVCRKCWKAYRDRWREEDKRRK